MTDTTDIAALREALCKLKSVEGLRTLAAESIDQLEAERQRAAEITEQYVDITTALSFAAQRAEAAEKSSAFLKEQLAQQANFNPDWDMLEACRESWREVVALLKEREAELEAERQRADKAENSELEQRLANAEHQLYMKDLAIHNVRAQRKAQFKKRKAVEAELAALKTDIEYYINISNELATEVESLKVKLSNPVVLSDCSFEAVSHMAHWYSKGECVAWVSGAEHVKKQILEAGFTVKGE